MDWTREQEYGAEFWGLLYQPVLGGGLDPLRTCGSDPVCDKRALQWQPCLAMRSDGHFVICWAEAEDPLLHDPFFNIYLQLFAPDGGKVGDEVIVNQPEMELGDSTQKSPAVAFDDTGNLVATWFGPTPDGCPYEPTMIYARRFEWDGGVAEPQAVSSQFIVNSDVDHLPIGEYTHPTVSLSRAGDGRFIVAWNTSRISTGPDEIHGQYFGGGRPLGGEFRINQTTGYQGDGLARRIANSAQHTVAYGPDGEVVCAWTKLEWINNTVSFTRLPGGFADYQESLYACIKGDVNRDGLVDGLDIQPFVDLLLGGVECLSIVDICPADMDSDGEVHTDDIPCFVQKLLTGESDCEGGGRDGGGINDCNENSIADANDIAYGTSEDCNANYIPDECDVDPSDPDGDGETSNDLNANGTPDECEPDCNENGVPDDKDIADETSTDVNSNGIPDECDPDCNYNDVPDDWDISQETSDDCNENGTPDECEPDCNHNDVPDDCDLDPTDPDGDEFVSEDCNENNYPDECDLTLPPGFGSLDCNDNDIPDECDLAACEGEAWCDDCNENGFLDVCDIAAEISDDENENGIPDECEGGGESGGGGEGAPSGDGDQAGGADTDAAWAAFFEWSMDQSWGPDADISGAAQFQMMINKLDELGLPLADPWYLLTTASQS